MRLTHVCAARARWKRWDSHVFAWTVTPVGSASMLTTPTSPTTTTTTTTFTSTSAIAP